MNIVIRELRANRKSLIIWSLSMAFLVFAGMVKYSGFSQAGQSVNDLFKQMPPALMKVFSMEGLDLTKISAYYAIFYLYFVLLGGIHAAMLGATIISKEERDKTADFLFVKPIPRYKVITAKVISACINVLVLNLVTCASSLYFISMFNTGDPINTEVYRLMTALWVIQMVFLSIGFGISSLVKTAKKATSLSTFLILAMFMLSVAIDLKSDLEVLTFLTPFKYFRAAEVMNSGSFSLAYILLSLVITIGGFVTTYLFYNRKDLHC